MKIPLLHGIIMRYAFAHQIKKTDQFKNLEFAFVDSRGKKYYLYTDHFNLPLDRLEELIRLRAMWDEKVDKDYIKKWREQCETVVQGEDKDRIVFEMSQMLAFLKMRQEVEFDPNLIFKMCCCVYVCEDQNPAIWDEEYENKKFDRLKKEVAERGGLLDFFQSAGMKQYFPFWSYTENGLKKYLDLTLQEIEKSEEALTEMAK